MPKKIKFTESQRMLIKEVQSRQRREIKKVLNMIAEEHGILDDVKENPDNWVFEEDLNGIYRVDKPRRMFPGGKKKSQA